MQRITSVGAWERTQEWEKWIKTSQWWWVLKNDWIICDLTKNIRRAKTGTSTFYMLFIYLVHWGWHVCLNQLIQLGFLSALRGREDLYQNCLESFAFRYMFNLIILDVMMIFQNLLVIVLFRLLFKLFHLLHLSPSWCLSLRRSIWAIYINWSVLTQLWGSSSYEGGSGQRIKWICQRKSRTNESVIDNYNLYNEQCIGLDAQDIRTLQKQSFIFSLNKSGLSLGL